MRESLTSAEVSAVVQMISSTRVPRGLMVIAVGFLNPLAREDPGSNPGPGTQLE